MCERKEKWARKKGESRRKGKSGTEKMGRGKNANKNNTQNIEIKEIKERVEIESGSIGGGKKMERKGR